MQKSSIVAGMIALVLGIAILFFAEGLRRFYSGLFFMLMGLVLLWRSRSKTPESGAS